MVVLFASAPAALCGRCRGGQQRHPSTSRLGLTGRWQQHAAAAAQRRQHLCAASNASNEPGPSGEAEKLNKLFAVQPITGKELRQLVYDKWQRSYDVRLQRRGKNMYIHIMWRFLEQQSFPLTEEEYEMQLDAVADYLNCWQVQDTVREGIKAARQRGPGYTGGGNARAVSIPLGVDVSGAGRSEEWNSF